MSWKTIQSINRDVEQTPIFRVMKILFIIAIIVFIFPIPFHMFGGLFERGPYTSEVMYYVGGFLKACLIWISLVIAYVIVFYFVYLITKCIYWIKTGKTEGYDSYDAGKKVEDLLSYPKDLLYCGVVLLFCKSQGKDRWLKERRVNREAWIKKTFHKDEVAKDLLVEK